MLDTAQTQAQTAPTSNAPQVVLFDSDAPEHRVPFATEKKGKLYKVAHIFRSPSDDELLEYERRRNVRMREASKTELGEKGLAMENDSESAAVWLWNKLAIRLEGYVQVENWREKVSDADKEYAITQGLLTCEAISPDPELADDPLDFDDDDAPVTNTVELKCFYNGHPLTLTHILREASAADISTYKALMKVSYTVRGSKLGKSDIRIPSKAKPLAKLYDGMVIETTGYTGRVPLHHKMAVVLEHLAKEQENLAGN
jgi:hypothetical protein